VTMSAMNFDDLNQLERQLLSILKEEYSFYQSLYIMLDKQRDLVQYNKDDHLLDLFAEIERCHLRIKKSEEKITALKTRNPHIFKMAVALPSVKKLINSIATLLKKNINLVHESEEYMKGRYERIKTEMGELQNSHKIMQYLTNGAPSPQFVDGKK